MEGLAARAGVSVDTIRYYQARGLLHPPRRQGRVVYYDQSHLARLRRVRALQERGFSLATIARVLSGQLDEADQALVGAVANEDAPAADEPLLTLAQLADRTGIPVELLAAVANEGLLVPKRVGDDEGYTEQDVAAARAGLTLLQWGIPLSELLQVAAEHHRAVTALAQRAIDLFDRHVRHHPGTPAATAGDDPDPERLVEAFHALLPAATTLVGHHFTRVLLQQATEHIERFGSPGERQVALRTERPTRSAARQPTAPQAAAR